MADDDVTLSVGGQRHDGWTSISVTRAIDGLCGGFTLGLAERWADQPTRFVLEAGAACTVQIGGETLISGYIDSLEPSIDPESHGITISGRDRAGDLIDCSAIAKPGSWRDTSIEAIAGELARPFGITVSAMASTGPKLRRFALQQGETVQAAIERLCRFAGLLAVSNAAGNVELIQPSRGAAVETFVQGGNILASSARHDVSGRFSEYLVKGQSAGDDHAHGATVAQPSGTAGDPAIMRHRPLLVIAEEQTTIANAGVRARWEASTRAGRGQSATLTVPGWRRPDGRLRACNTIVRVTSEWLFIDGPMLVQAVTFVKDGRGTVSELSLVPPEAWSQLAVSETAAPSRVGKKPTAKPKAT